MATKKEYEKRDYHQEVTNLVLDSFQKARDSNWKTPWFPQPRSRPFNALTKRAYQGANYVSLGYSGFTDPQWLTKPQMDLYAKKHNLQLQIRKGSKSSTIFKAFVKDIIEDENGNPLEKPKKIVLMIRAGAAFNAEQIEGMPLYQQKTREFTPVFAAEQLLEALKEKAGLRIVESNARAYYSPTLDHIALPARNTFKGDELFYDTAFHESGHWTGHESRLNRKQTGAFGSKDYAYEEFVAEMSSNMLTSEVGIRHDSSRHENFLDYMHAWQKALEADKYLIFKASNAASRSTNFQMEHLREHLYELNMNHTASPEQNELLESIGLPERILKQLHTEEAEQESEARQEEQAQVPSIENAPTPLQSFIETLNLPEPESSPAPTMVQRPRPSMGMRM